MSNYKKPFTFKVGTVTFDEPYEGNISYETAAWYTTYALQPGTYDVYGTYERSHLRPDQMEFRMFTGEIPGIILDDHTPSMFGGVAYGSNQNKRNDEKINKSLPVTSYDVKTGKMKFDPEVSFITKEPVGKEFHKFVVDKDSVEWKQLMVERDRYNFKQKLMPLLNSRANLFEIAQKNGLLTNDNVDQGIEMGAFKFEKVISLDMFMRSKLGYGIPEAGVPLKEAADRFAGRYGDMGVITNEVMKDLVKDYELPLKPKKDSEISYSQP